MSRVVGNKVLLLHNMSAEVVEMKGTVGVMAGCKDRTCVKGHKGCKGKWCENWT